VWDGLAGKPDAGEEPLHAANREWQEESGIVLKDANGKELDKNRSVLPEKLIKLFVETNKKTGERTVKAKEIFFKHVPYSLYTHPEFVANCRAVIEERAQVNAASGHPNKHGTFVEMTALGTIPLDLFLQQISAQVIDGEPDMPNLTVTEHHEAFIDEVPDLAEGQQTPIVCARKAIKYLYADAHLQEQLRSIVGNFVANLRAETNPTMAQRARALFSM
jgi:hypothetical protein